jgi:hypothetical protein
MTDSNDNRDERIKIKAFYIWLDEGCPDGRADAHWDMAAELIAIEDNYRGTLKPIGEAGERVEPLLAIENAGEFPTLTDQGEEETIKPPGRKSEEAAPKQPRASAETAKTARPKSSRG